MANASVLVVAKLDIDGKLLVYFDIKLFLLPTVNDEAMTTTTTITTTITTTASKENRSKTFKAEALVNTVRK